MTAAPVGLADGIEARAIRSALTRTAYVLRGGRSHLFLLTAGAGRVLADVGETGLTAPCLAWLPHGESRSVELDAGSSGAALSVPDPVLGGSLPEGSVGSHIREVIGRPLLLHPPSASDLDRLAELIATIRGELFANALAAQSVVRHCLSLALIEIWRMTGPETAGPRPSPRNIVHGFLFLVDLHLRDHWTVQRYATHMGVSKDRLTSAVRRATGRTPLAHIHGRLMAEARTLLTGSGLQVAEVAYKLGFTDAAYFNRFFQRHAGEPPGRYRNAQARRRPAPDASFAAWP